MLVTANCMNYTPLNSRKAFTHAAYSPIFRPMSVHNEQFPSVEPSGSSEIALI